MLANGENAMLVLQDLKVLADSIIENENSGFEDGNIIAEAKTKKLIDVLTTN